jgi:hypothetical protein
LEPKGRGAGRKARLELPKKPITIFDAHVCPTVVETEDGELAYVVDGC